ncbi:uncharacterized protein BO87DRAFT_400520 [Aspergillus neoniger CBS 115656]|uniref:Uncharacterized protein n=1 Tax=Aspergillus neoniger (strain CBS 115656) TaxID=1448310 RepID=A0A318Y7J4_ASPNB|nr:hypothetical protein BO87DRAFT_400520 [Aspergillus neoniger CBS 115656]PYH30275.1 hypothetical protein BO87DRAFT_400520 [Aspergillus neoniger CBS 115656]
MEAPVMQMTMCFGRVSTLLYPTGGGCRFRAGYRRLACIDDSDRFLFPGFPSELGDYGSGNHHRLWLKHGIQSSWRSHTYPHTSEVEFFQFLCYPRFIPCLCLEGGKNHTYWATNFTGMMPSSHCDWVISLPRGAVSKRRPTLDRLPSLRLRFPFAQDLAPENSLLRSHRLLMQCEVTLATPYAYVLLH